MMQRIRVSTGLVLVIGTFVCALVAAIAVGWASAKQSSVAMVRLNSLQTGQYSPVYETYGLFLRARVAMAGALLEMQEGRRELATTTLQRAEGLIRGGAEHFKTFVEADKGSTGRELEAALQRAFDTYAVKIEAQRQALLANDSRLYVAANVEARDASAVFDEAMRALFTHVEGIGAAAMQDASQRYMTSRIVAIALLLAAVALTVACGFFVSRAVLRPLRRAGDAFDRIADGDLTSRLDYDSRNEIGVLFAAMRRMQAGLTHTVSAVRRGVHEVHLGSREISAGNTDLSSRTEEQAASLEETAASMEELAVTVKRNADNADEANTLAARASAVAQRGGQTVGQVVDTMQEISRSSRQISEIVSVIESIAFQTNILALNAAVESARAGEQGKGFAVVAGEVRALAQRSAQAAREIKELINESVEKVNTGSAQVGEAGTTMEEIVAAVKRVSDIVAGIAQASAEQAAGIEQVNQAVSQMDETTQQNAALVEEAAAAAGSLEKQASELGAAVAVFRIAATEALEAAEVYEPVARLAGPGARVQYAG